MIYSINEGQQAEEYKARKAKEAEDMKKRETDRSSSRYNYNYNKNKASMGILSDLAKKDPTGTMTDDAIRTISDKTKRNTERNATAWNSEIERERSRRGYGDTIERGYNLQYAHDAMNRHKRRHPDQYRESCGIFFNVSFI